MSSNSILPGRRQSAVLRPRIAPSSLAMVGVMLPLALLFSGCISPVHTRSARVLAPGENEVSASLSAAQLMAQETQWFDGTSEPSKKPATSHGLANVAPELSYHRGLLPNLELGARIGGAGLLAEAEGQYRFLSHAHGLGVVQMAAGLQAGRQFSAAVAGSRVVVPLRITLQVSGAVGITLGLHGGWRWVDQPAVDPQLLADKIDPLLWVQGKDGLELGAGLLADYHSDDWVGRLGLEVSRWNGQVGAQGKLSDYGITVVQAVLSFGRTWGKDAAEVRKSAEDLESLTKPAGP